MNTRIIAVGIVVLIGVVSSVSADSRREMRELPIEVEADRSSSTEFLRVDVSAFRQLGVSNLAMGALELDVAAEPGDEIQLWVLSGDGLPWEQDEMFPAEVWPVDETTGTFVRFDLVRLAHLVNPPRAPLTVVIRRLDKEGEPAALRLLELSDARLAYQSR